MVDWRERLELTDERSQAAIASLLAEAGLEGGLSLHPLSGGANNRVFRVEANGAPALLKIYFRHPDDTRDRLAAEFSFCRFAWENGARSLPRPLACDLRNRLGLYEFVAGRQLLSHQITEGLVRQALDFYQELNRHKRLPAARALPKASEACFTIAEHLQRVESRVQKLKGLDDPSPVGREAAVFIGRELSDAWLGVLEFVGKRCGELGLALQDEIARQDKCLSPSDFGFHNALLTDGERLRFIDFEYAGWDDPAKLVCDFFCQPAVPVPLDYYDCFVGTVVSGLSEPEMHLQRMALLFPVYQVKWCCILLNDFLSAGGERRRFARGDSDEEERKSSQLKKARSALRNLARWRKAKGEVPHKYFSKV